MPGPPTTPLPPSTASQEALSGEPHRVPVLQVRGLGLSRATGGGSVCDATTLQCGLPAVVTQRKNEPLVKGLVNFYKATRKVLVPCLPLRSSKGSAGLSNVTARQTFFQCSPGASGQGLSAPRAQLTGSARGHQRGSPLSGPSPQQHTGQKEPHRERWPLLLPGADSGRPEHPENQPGTTSRDPTPGAQG